MKTAHPTKVLIVDDDELILMALRQKLEKEGMQVFTSSNIYDAYFKVNQIEPDLILLDIVLPDMNGLSFMNMINSNVLDTRIPVILMSSLATDDIIEKSYEMGASGYITKPFDMNSITGIIKQHTHRAMH
ncbi:MAG: response regulator [Bacteroidota bacterium]|nr:response regulator [Bacteroidota bacterium]